MNENLQTKVFEWVQGAAEKVSDFAEKEVPPFINEYLTWKFFEAGASIVFYGIYLILLLIFIWKALGPLWVWGIQGWKDSKSDSEFQIIAPLVLTILFSFISMCFFPYNEIKTCIQIKVAPKVFLLEKASELIKKQ